MEEFQGIATSGVALLAMTKYQLFHVIASTPPVIASEAKQSLPPRHCERSEAISKQPVVVKRHISERQGVDSRLSEYALFA